MTTLERLRPLLGNIPKDVLEVRLRTGKPAQFRCMAGDLLGKTIGNEALRDLLSTLTDHSLYARERELRNGFFTMGDGCRVGVCGQVLHDGDQTIGMTAIGSVCIRVCREVKGASDAFYDALFDDGTRALRSALIVSEPGMGKTTALRDAARRLAEDGYNVCISDERHELAACVDGIPTLDVGSRTDVMDGCPKHIAIERLLRSMSPQVIVTDEIGDRRDSEALAEAARCGVRILASAHAGRIEHLFDRKNVPIGIFDIAVLLGDRPGQVSEIRAL